MTKNRKAMELCELCGAGDAVLTHAIVDVPLGAGGNAEILNVRTPVWECQSCNGRYHHEDAEDVHHDAICDHLGRLRPAAIRALRMRMHMNSHEFHEYTGIGIASIKRWESGSQIQTRAFDNLLRFYKEKEDKRDLSGVVYKVPVFQTIISEDRHIAAKSFKLTV